MTYLKRWRDIGTKVYRFTFNLMPWCLLTDRNNKLVPYLKGKLLNELSRNVKKISACGIRVGGYVHTSFSGWGRFTTDNVQNRLNTFRMYYSITHNSLLWVLCQLKSWRKPKKHPLPVIVLHEEGLYPALRTHNYFALNGTLPPFTHPFIHHSRLPREHSLGPVSNEPNPQWEYVPGAGRQLNWITENWPTTSRKRDSFDEILREEVIPLRNVRDLANWTDTAWTCISGHSITHSSHWLLKKFDSPWDQLPNHGLN